MKRLIGCSKCLRRHVADAWETNTPGLVIVDTSTAKHAKEGAMPYTVTHERSGLRITAHDEFKEAHATAGALGGLGVDWTASGDAVVAGLTPEQRKLIAKVTDGQASSNYTEAQRAQAAKLRAS